NPGDTIRFTAVATDSLGHPIPGKVFTWSSSNTAIATIDATTGKATAVAIGNTTITARVDSASGTAVLNVGATHITGGNNVLLLEADGSGYDLKNHLVATGIYTADQITDLPFSSTPPLSALSNYGCVITWTNYS